MSRTISYIGLIALAFAAAPTWAAFDSGSDGSDGALDLTGQSGLVVFDPASMTRPDGQRVDPEKDNIFHFTTITIPAGVTLKLSIDKIPNVPVHWLATGDVVIAGTVDLRGGDGHAADQDALRVPSIPGPGGFAGGVSFGPNGGCTFGLGPGASSQCGWSASHAASCQAGTSDGYGNLFLQPLIGGSGGSGAEAANFTESGGGGGGGGAILLAASANKSISIDGIIDARGGRGGAIGGGYGSGGAIRLVANAVQGTGSLLAEGYPGAGCTYGRVRIEAGSNQFTGTIDTTASRLVRLIDSTNILPRTSQATLRVVSVAAVSAPDPPTGSFDPPDVTIDSAQDVPVVIEATNIPAGTTVTVQVFNDTEGQLPDRTAQLTATQDPSQTTATVRIPPGYSGILAEADWTQ